MLDRARFALLAVVAAIWLAVWLLVALGLALSDAPGISVVALAGAATTAFVCRACARTLPRLHRVLWLPAAMSFVAASLVPAYGLLWSLGLVNHSLTGPPSPLGLTTIISVRDAHLGWSADFYSDVRVLDGSGKVVAEWRDTSGQGHSDGPRALRDSMRWTSPTTLEFVTHYDGDREILTVPRQH